MNIKMELQAKTLISTLTPGMGKNSTDKKMIRLSDLVGVKIVRETVLEIYTKDDNGNIDFDEVDIVALYALKKQVKDAINRKQAIIALMQQLQALRDMGVEEVDISGYHITRIKECSTSTT
jgi:L-fucose isomerase-like protein